MNWLEYHASIQILNNFCQSDSFVAFAIGTVVETNRKLGIKQA